MIIGVSGLKGSGKDFGAKVITQFFKKHFFSVQNYALADPIKEMACFLFGVDRKIAWGTQKQKEETLVVARIKDRPVVSVRKLLQYLGTEVFRNAFNEYFWVDIAVEKAKKAANDFFVISDVRFQNEAEAINIANGVNIRIFRFSDNTDKHASEIDLIEEDNNILQFFGRDGNDEWKPDWFKVPSEANSHYSYIVFNTSGPDEFITNMERICEDIKKSYIFCKDRSKCAK